MAQSKKKKSAVPPVTKSATPRRLLGTEPDLNQEDVTVVNAVREFEFAKQAIRIFLEDNKDLMDQYRTLLEEAEQKFQEADKLVRARDVSCGDWDRYTERTSYDPDTLHSLVGDKKFMELGGTIGKKTTYEIPGEKIEIAIALKHITPEQALLVKKVTPSYHTPTLLP